MSEALRQALDLSVFWEYRDILVAGLAFNAAILASCSASE